MVAAKAGDVAGVLARPDPRIVVFLLYGPDSGLVSERAGTIVGRSVEDSSDPFQVVRLDGDVLAADPGRLADEVGTIGLFGGRRAVWVKATPKTIVPAVEVVLTSPPEGAVVVIEGGDLPKSSGLRTLCERSPRAVALPCYADGLRDLEAVVDTTLREAGLSIAGDARSALLGSLGGDRLATRGELSKLVLYARGQSEITLEDIDAVLSDVSSLAMDAVVDASFAGDLPGLEAGARRLAAEGIPPSILLGSALRHALQLLPARLDVEAGKPVAAVLDTWRGLHFRRKPAVLLHLKRWTSGSLKSAIAALQAALLDTRRVAALDEAIATRILIDLGRASQRR